MAEHTMCGDCPCFSRNGAEVKCGLNYEVVHVPGGPLPGGAWRDERIYSPNCGLMLIKCTNQTIVFRETETRKSFNVK